VGTLIQTEDGRLSQRMIERHRCGSRSMMRSMRQSPMLVSSIALPCRRNIASLPFRPHASASRANSFIWFFLASHRPHEMYKPFVAAVVRSTKRALAAGTSRQGWPSCGGVGEGGTAWQSLSEIASFLRLPRGASNCLTRSFDDEHSRQNLRSVGRAQRARSP
jgi:hypothetical protein